MQQSAGPSRFIFAFAARLDGERTEIECAGCTAPQSKSELGACHSQHRLTGQRLYGAQWRDDDKDASAQLFQFSSVCT